MHKKVRELVDALRSGKYSQYKHGLRSGDSYCCLGVMCDLTDPTAWTCAENDDWDHPYSYSGSDRHLPPPAVAEEWGLYTRGANLGLSREALEQIIEDKGWSYDPMLPMSFVTLNDILGLSFVEIADIIETHHLTIFPGLYKTENENALPQI